MKKLLAMLALWAIVFTGCTENELALKEKCASYIDKAKKYAQSQTTSTDLIIHQGTYYSKTKETCISIFLDMAQFHLETGKPGGLNQYYDELTGDYLSVDKEYIIRDDNMKWLYTDYDGFEKSLKLVK